MTFFVVIVVIVVVLIVVGAVAERFTKPATDATPKPDTDKVPYGAIAASPGSAAPVGLSKYGSSQARPAKKRDVNQRQTLSPDLDAFSQRHGIPLDRFFNAAGMTKAEYARRMESIGAIIAYNVTPCSKAGHAIRNRYGKCVACDPKQIAFNQRALEAGSVYAAFSPSKGLIKVGFTKDVRRRHNALVRQRYAGAGDWELYYQKEAEDGGRREIEAHKELARYAVKGLTYFRDGRTQEADEVYECSKERAIRALEGR
ncbi:GIY-YIG nuclease family protein [Bradyrhizobium sp. AZCC 1693]|uniref:GIY-YIG nuclease family protein n=1 Tax=Bradyrhizobium sp. AZCC 1693 TaxID=3117029 RepID=UPI002FF0A1D6